MAADNTAARIAHQTLVAATIYKVNLTVNSDDVIEIIHHGDAAQPVYFDTATTEAGLTTISAVKQDEIGVVIAGERIRFRVGDNESTWISLYSAGIPTVTVRSTTSIAG